VGRVEVVDPRVEMTESMDFLYVCCTVFGVCGSNAVIGSAGWGNGILREVRGIKELGERVKNGGSGVGGK